MESFKIFFGLLIVLLFYSSGLAAVPDLVNFQGVLRDTAGNPVADGSYSVTFRLYDTPIGGGLVWEETQSVTTSDGLFNVLLGSIQSLEETLFNSPDRYLAVRVGTDPETTPRTRLVTVPYSHRVATVDGATGGTISGDINIQSNLNVSDTAQTTVFKMPTGAGSGKVLTSDANGVGTWQNPAAATRLIATASGTVEDGIDNGPVTGRSVTFTKVQGNSRLRITYSDNIHVFGSGAQTSTWEIMLDGSPISNPNPLKMAFYSSNSTTAYTHQPTTLVGYANGVSAGAHTVSVRVYPTPGYSPSSNAYTGWQSSFLLEVEEIP
ncbi:MAG: hypothetical protein ACM3YF_07315 [Candidatus Zixiibacteriota bacterium]